MKEKKFNKSNQKKSLKKTKQKQKFSYIFLPTK